MKRIICILLIFIMTIPLSFSVSFAEDEFYTDRTFEVYKQRTELLTALGILDESDIGDLSAEVSLKKFIEVCGRIIGQTVPDSDKNNAWHISVAESLGIESGYETGFDSKINTPIVVKTLIGLLGYDMLLESYDYISAANRIGLLDGISVSDEYVITNDVLMHLLDNALNVKVIKSDLSSNSITKPGGKWLWERFKTEKKEGVVTAGIFSDLIKDSETAKGYVEIDRQKYKVYQDFPELLGFAVVYYVNDDGNIIYIHKDEINKVTRINSDELISYESRCYKYEESGKDKTKTLPSDCYIIYNSRACAAPGIDMMMPKNGYIEFIDNDGDGKCEVLNIVSYDIVEIYNADYDNYIIYSEKKMSERYDFKDAIETGKCSVISSDGESVGFDYLKSGDVAAIYISEKGEIANIRLITKTVLGKITAVSKTDGDSIYVDGAEHKATDNVFKTDGLGIGEKFKFYIYGGKVCYAKKLQTDNGIGYLIEAKLTDKKDDAFEKSVSVRLLDSDGNVGIYELDKNLKIDNVSVKDADKGLNLLKKQDGSFDQVVEYSLNAEGKVVNLNTPYNNKGALDITAIRSITPSNGEGADSLRLIYPETLLRHQHMQRTFGGKFNYLTSTAIFRVPSDISQEDDDYTVTSYGIFSGWGDYTIEAYANSDGNLVADALVVKLNVENDAPTYGVVSDVSVVMKDNEDSVNAVTIITNSGEQAYWTHNDEYVSGVEKGDVVKFLCNVNLKLVKKISVIYDASESKLLSPTNPTADAALTGYGRRVILGYVYEIDSGVALISTLDPSKSTDIPDSKTETHNINQYSQCIMVEKAKKIIVRKADISEIRDYKHVGSECSFAALYTTDGTPGFMVIYK